MYAHVHMHTHPPTHPTALWPPLQMRTKLEAAGGKVIDQVLLSGVDVYSDGVALTISGQTAPGGAAVDGGAGAAAAASAAAAGGAGGGGGSGELPQGPRVKYSSMVTTRLLLDCMGHASPVVRQLRCVGIGSIAMGWFLRTVSSK